jgi:hypothetical protein
MPKEHNNICECGSPSAQAVGSRSSYNQGNGCARCRAIEGWLDGERISHAYGNRPAKSHRKLKTIEGYYHPLKKGALVAIRNACDRFLHTRGI